MTRVLTYEQDTEMRCRQARAEGLEEGMEKGMEKGMDQFGGLVSYLIYEGRLDDAKRAAADASYRDLLLAEFEVGGGC